MSFDRKPYEDTKKILDSVSPSFCLAKWMHVTLHLHEGKNHSCYHSLMHEIPVDLVKKDPSVLHNTPYKAERRKEMLEGKRPHECEFCWAVEDLGGVSDRFNMSHAEWAQAGLSLIDKRNPAQKINPTYVEVSFSNTCNFRCSYCSASASSRWQQELQQHGPYPVRGEAFKYIPSLLKEEENPWIEAWWKWFPQIYPTLRYLRITGGEPLLSENTFRLLDFISQNENTKLNFAVNSNLGTPRSVIERFVKALQPITQKIPQVTIFTSVDTWGPQAEYTRNGLQLDLFRSNIEYLLTECPDIRISFMITFQILSLPHFTDLMDELLRLKKKFNTANFNRTEYSIDQLIRPTHQHVLILPEQHDVRFAEIEKYMESRVTDDSYSLDPKQLSRFQVIRSWFQKNLEYSGIEQDRADFFRFFSHHDRLRKTSFLSTFPEYSEFWDQCADAAAKI